MVANAVHLFPCDLPTYFPRFKKSVSPGGARDGNPIKKKVRKYKYGSEDEALVAHKQRRNQAPKERRHHARTHVLVASREKAPTKQCMVVVKKRRDGYIGNGASHLVYKTKKIVVPG